MEMAMKNEKRAERRKRIMSGETDRMALITGQLQALPPPPPPSPSSPSPFLLHQRGHSHTGIPSSFAKELQKNPDSVPIATFNAISKPRDEKRAIALLKRMSISEVPEVNINAALENTKLNHKKLDPIGEVTTEIIKSPTSASTTMAPKAYTDINKPLLKTTHPSKPKLFTSRRLHACIVASQTTRVFCSLFIASLAVLSHSDHTLFIISNILKSKIVSGSKPLYILLLTNATIVAARMLAERQKDSREAEEECEKTKEDGHNVDSAAMKVLDRGLVSYQALLAISIDLSVYAVVLICGISLL